MSKRSNSVFGLAYLILFYFVVWGFLIYVFFLCIVNAVLHFTDALLSSPHPQAGFTTGRRSTTLLSISVAFVSCWVDFSCCWQHCPAGMPAPSRAPSCLQILTPTKLHLTLR